MKTELTDDDIARHLGYVDAESLIDNTLFDSDILVDIRNIIADDRKLRDCK